ncbi:MBL fold metallo-hydrolase [Deinococcus sp.]|uniref:MBL fold metallo-hydrolase n=1 Tax=Deinococcus sp. TaxID=47478 RepID=UPI0025BDC038|nr:MBL fold metallo-hydrolase [Deinococcus sp.]
MTLSPAAYPSLLGGTTFLRPDVVQVRLPIVNAYFLGQPGGEWVLVDSGTPLDAGFIGRAAQQIHGSRPPSAIILTHGHVDHVGSVKRLREAWPVPVYAHATELPFLTGQAKYQLGGRSSAAPDLRPHVHALPGDGSVPHLPGWRWVPTPGHTPGHLSLWREADQTIIVGDAVSTANARNPVNLFTGEPARISHAFLYQSRSDGRASVGRLADLTPELLAVGHGKALSGHDLGAALREHQAHFDDPAPHSSALPLLALAAGTLGLLYWLSRER